MDRPSLSFLALISALVAFGCDETLSCGPGTRLIGSQCVAENEPVGADDAGGSEQDSGRSLADAGSRSDSGPNVRRDSGPLPDGSISSGGGACEGAECAAWADDILSRLESLPDRSCDTPIVAHELVAEIAQAHAMHQATTDMLTADSPDGNFFEQFRARGLAYDDGASAFSFTYDGAADVVERWSASATTGPLLRRCFDLGGVGVATSSTGRTYVTALLLLASSS